MKMVNHETEAQNAYFVNFRFDGNYSVENQKIFQRIEKIESWYCPLIYVQHTSRTESPSHNVRILRYVQM